MGGGGGGGTDSPSFSRYLIKMAVRAHCNYQSLRAALLPGPLCVSVRVRTVRLRLPASVRA